MFVGLGFRVVEGPEIDLAYYNFDALNHDVDHPARARADTFYVADDVVLRTQTSPMQVRVMEKQAPPLYIIVPGRVYRPDNDATHTPQFHQVEGLAVDEGLTLGRPARARCSRSPARSSATTARSACGRTSSRSPSRASSSTSPASTASRASCATARAARCARARPGSRSSAPAWWTRTCTATSPTSGYDPEKHQGFAWGMGIERIAFLKHGVPDLRMFFENDLRLLEQFG